jgi:hypothetical protein
MSEAVSGYKFHFVAENTDPPTNSRNFLGCDPSAIFDHLRMTSVSYLRPAKLTEWQFSRHRDLC